MNITATENALSFLEEHPEFHLPRTARECFGGMITLDGRNTPNLTDGLGCIDNILSQIKFELREDIAKISPKYSTLNPATTSHNYIIDNVDITLITTEDEKTTAVPVRNLFKYHFSQNTEVSYEVITCLKGPDKEKYDKNDCLLGLYLPKTGSIMLWIDRIINKKNRKELIFQKVLLHEMIHAFLDIYPRVFFQHPNGMPYALPAIGNPYPNADEETIDNMLVLHCYSHCHKEYCNFVKDFISKQPVEYSNAIGKTSILDDVKLLLSQKVEKNKAKNFYISNKEFYYIVNDQDDNDYNENDYLMDLYKQGLSCMQEVVPFKEYDESNTSSDIICKKLLLSHGCPDFRSHWMIYKLNLSSKTISLRIGNILFYQYKPIREEEECIKKEEECIDLINFQKATSTENLKFDISSPASSLIIDLIRCINPETVYDWDVFIPESD